MMNSEQDFKLFAQKKLAEIYSEGNYSRIHDFLSDADPSFKTISIDTFNREFLTARLALSALVWENFFGEYQEKTDKNLFFKMVMNGFQDPKFIGLASRFSEYYHETNDAEKNESMIAIGKSLFKVLEVPVTLDDEKFLNPAFERLLQVFEGIKCSLENEFEAFQEQV